MTLEQEMEQYTIPAFNDP